MQPRKLRKEMPFEYITHVSPTMLALCTVGYLLVCFVSWYLLATMNYGLNGGQLGRHPYLFPFQCFAEEWRCYWFGGKKHRIEFIKCRCRGNGSFCGFKRSFTHQEIRENNLYEEAFLEMCGGGPSFWGGNLFLFFFGPLIVVLALLMGLVGWLVIFPIRWLIGRAIELIANRADQPVP